MKTFATFGLLIGVSALLASSAYASPTNISCQPDAVDSQMTRPPPSSPCAVGDEYDAGDANIKRDCTYDDPDKNLTNAPCEVLWSESYLHRIGPGCTDGGFVEQVDGIFYNTCPF
jgi:hypothetical protein